MLFLFEVDRVNLPWDSYYAHLIRADSEFAARKFLRVGDEGDAVWETAKVTIVSYGHSRDPREPGIIISSFMAG